MLKKRCPIAVILTTLALLGTSSVSSVSIAKTLLSQPQCTNSNIKNYIQQLKNGENAAFDALVGCNSKAVPALTKALENKDGNFRIAIITVLGEIREKASPALSLLKKKIWQRPKSLDAIIHLIEKSGRQETKNIQPQMFQRPTNTNVSQRSKTYVLSLSANSFSANLKTIDSTVPKKSRSATVCIKLPRNSAFVFEFEPPSRDIVCTGILLGSLQVLDGYLTSVGVSHFGTQREANFLLRKMMHMIGPDYTLIIAKSAAILIVVLLTMIARKQRVFKPVINILCLIYLFAAIIPWIYILRTEI